VCADIFLVYVGISNHANKGIKQEHHKWLVIMMIIIIAYQQQQVKLKLHIQGQVFFPFAIRIKEIQLTAFVILRVSQATPMRRTFVGNLLARLELACAVPLFA
jgi:hypothetical protein